MFTIGKIVIPDVRRLAENADSRMDIRRQDPDQERRAGQDKREESQPEDSYDNAVVGVQSLRDFLEEFLRSLVQTAIDPAQTITPPPASVAAQAAGAYQATARTTIQSSGTAQAPDNKQLLQQEDIAAIRRLLGMLEALHTRGVDHLTLIRGETFLGSLTAAAQAALNAVQESPASR